jgi:AAA ATPase domain
MAGGGSGQRLVGRARPLGELEAALREAVAGRGALALVTGEAGIGKSRLAAELAAKAPSLGAQVVWASCWDGGGRLRCWVGWVDGRPVSVAASWVTGDLVDVVWVATLPRARRRATVRRSPGGPPSPGRACPPSCWPATTAGPSTTHGIPPLLRFTVWLHPGRTPGPR